MKLSLLPRLSAGKTILFALSNFFISFAHAQTFNQITYASSGLTVSTDSYTDVLAGNPTIGGYEHKTASYASQVSTEGGILYTFAPGFDGTSLILWANNGLSKITFNSGTTSQYIVDFTDLVTTVLSINYVFQPNYNYYITVNYSSQSINGFIGLGISIGTPSFTTTMSQAGSGPLLSTAAPTCIFKVLLSQAYRTSLEIQPSVRHKAIPSQIPPNGPYPGLFLPLPLPVYPVLAIQQL
jgi:hypothetical protein